jgi:hypothetical protein
MNTVASFYMLSNSLLFQCSDHKISEAIPVTGHGGPYGFEMLRIAHFLDNQHTDIGEDVSLTCQPCFTPQKDFLVLISVRS